MKIIGLAFYLLLILFCTQAKAQGPGNKDLGFGIILGDPTGLTIKYWTNRTNAIAGSIGGSYFGSPRIGIDYLWHFDAFHSNIAKLYAGPGGVIGFGESKSFWYTNKKGRFYVRNGEEIGLGLRGIFGLNVIPERTPLEIFLEVGVLVGLAPDFGSAADAGIGIRFYP
jgi:hypothetical protein